MSTGGPSHKRCAGEVSVERGKTNVANFLEELNNTDPWRTQTIKHNESVRRRGSRPSERSPVKQHTFHLFPQSLQKTNVVIGSSALRVWTWKWQRKEHAQPICYWASFMANKNSNVTGWECSRTDGTTHRVGLTQWFSNLFLSRPTSEEERGSRPAAPTKV